MGIVNRDGALYSATGIDNTGLYSGRREALGIIKAMAGEITSFDIFGGIGISAALAFAQAAKEAYSFEKQFQQSMKEVATLSSGIKGSLTDYMNQVIEITRMVPIAGDEAAKALYQIVSAGHDGANGMKILEVSAKAAIGGVTDTATSADGITTLLNAYKLDVSEAEKISDQLFTTVRLGKTSFGELGKSIAQVAPIAASYGVETDQVLAAVATLTKQGTPTAQAMTQIRASIIAVSKVLGDGAFDTRTYQEALAEVARQADGSETKLRELVPEVEAVNAVLGLTGINVQEAAGHLGEMQNAAGAAEAAFKEMASSAENQLKLLGNNVNAALRPLGQGILKEISAAAQSMNESFEDGSAQEALENIGGLIVVVTTALAGYKGSIIAVSAAKQIQAAVTVIVNKQRVIEAANLVLSKGMYAAEAAMVARNTSARLLLTKAIKAQTIAQLKNAAAMLTNPYVLAAAAFAALGYAIYKCATAETVAEKATRMHNAALEAQKKHFEDLKSKAEGFVSVIRDETSTQFDKLQAYKQLQAIMPNVLKNIDLETLKTMDLVDVLRLLNEDKNKQFVMGVKVKAVMKQEELDATTAEWQKAVDELADDKENHGLILKVGRLGQKKKLAEESVRLAKEEVEKVNEIQKKAAIEQKREEEKAAIQNKAFWTKQKDNADAALVAIASKQKKMMDAGNFKGIDAKVVEIYKANVKLLKEAEKELRVYDSSSKQEKQSDKLREEQEKYKLLMDKQARDQKRMELDSSNELKQLEIDRLKEGSEKVLRQRKLNHDKELEEIKREAEDKKIKAIEAARSAHESNPENKEKPFDAEKFAKSEPAKKQFASFDKVAEEKTKTTETKYNRGDDLAGLLSEYQDYTDKRLAIEMKFNNDIATLEEQRKLALKNGDTQQVEEIDRAKAQATKNKGMELMSMDYDKLKESPEYVRAFENLKETSSETLNSLLSQLENAKGAAAKVLSPDQLREYTTTIQEIMDELDARNPFQSLSDKKQELADAEQELADAQMALENARQTADAVKGGAKIENGVKSSKFNEKTGKIDSTKAYLTEAQALEKVKEKTEAYNDSKDKVVKKSAQLKKTEKETRDIIDDLSKSLSDVGNAIGGPAGEIISLIGNIGSFAMTAMSGVEAAADTSANAISTVEKASVILAIISAAIQIATKIASIFKDDDGVAKYEDAKEVYESYINILDRVIEKHLELAETLSGKNANAAYQKAIDTIKLQSEDAKTLGRQYLNSGASKGFLGIKSSASKGRTEVEDMSWEGWNQAAQALGMTIDDFKNKMGGRMEGLFDLTDEQLATLQTDAGIFWSQLDSDTQDYANQVADGVAKVAEVMEQRMTDTTLIDAESLRSDFQDLLTDMDADSADFADNFEGYMKDAIINSMIKDEYMDDLKAWREKLYNAMDDGVTEEEYDALKAEGQRISDEMKAKQEAMKEMYGWTGEDDEREASKKGIATASQDSVDENNGRLAVMQEHTYNINENLKELTNFGRVIMSDCSHLPRLEDIGDNLRTLTASQDIVISHLSNIENNTARLATIEETMSFIKTGIDTLNTKGITLKR